MSCRRGGALETKLDVYKRIMDVNFFGTVELTRHIAAVGDISKFIYGAGDFFVITNNF
jgi:hypothetical protein